jgi:hypothetical protein
MLAPRFSIRALLILVTGGAVFFLVAGMAVRGEAWAWGVTIAALCLVAAALAHALWFILVAMFARLTSHRQTNPADQASSRQVAGRPDAGEPLASGQIAL